MNVFLGINCSAEELGVKRQNFWAFTSNDTDKEAMTYFELDADKVFTQTTLLAAVLSLE